MHICRPRFIAAATMPKRTIESFFAVQKRPKTSPPTAAVHRDTGAVQSSDNAAAASQQAMWGSGAPRSSPSQPTAARAAAAVDVTSAPVPGTAAEQGAATATPAMPQPDHGKEAPEAPTPEMLAKWHADAARCLCAADWVCSPKAFTAVDTIAASRCLLCTHALSARLLHDEVHMRRNLEAAQAVVAAAQAAGRRPQLASLLVEQTWLQHMAPEFDKQYFGQLQRFLDAEWQAHTVLPPPEMIFRCLCDCFHFSCFMFHVSCAPHVSCRSMLVSRLAVVREHICHCANHDQIQTLYS